MNIKQNIKKFDIKKCVAQITHLANLMPVQYHNNNVYYTNYNYSIAQRRCPLTRRSELARALIMNI